MIAAIRPRTPSAIGDDEQCELNRLGINGHFDTESGCVLLTVKSFLAELSTVFRQALTRPAGRSCLPVVAD